MKDKIEHNNNQKRANIGWGFGVRLGEGKGNF